MRSTANHLTLRRKRNRYATAAVLILVVSMSISLPRAIHRRAELKATNDEVIRLQGALASIQQQERDLQAKIVETQAAILTLQKNVR